MNKKTLLSELTTYSNAVLSGKVTACKKHRWACLRFITDLERSEKNDPGFPYYFDEDKAERFLNWMRLFKHRKGVLKGKRIEPHIIQKFVFGSVYGWYSRHTGYRRFNKMFWQVARKNAKSQSLSCVGSYETMAFDMSSNEAAEVYVAATKTEQAKIVYDETVAMLESCKPLHGRFKVAYGRIKHLKSGSVMRALSEEDRKTGDGLNPQCGIVDEYHAHETSEIYDVIDSGMGARTQPLLAIITTAGFDLMNPCYRVEYDLCSKILNPDNPLGIDNYFVMINELDRNETGETIEINGRKIADGDLIDDIKDESVWEKANPIICSYPEGVDYLRKRLKEALEVPEKMRNFLTKHMNVWVNQRESGYMPLSKWASCGVSTSNPMPSLTGLKTWVGVDLSSTIDLTSVSFVTDLGNDRYCVKSHSFIPVEKLEIKRKTDKVPYDLWVKQGWITATEGAEVDYHVVLNYIVDQYDQNEWVKDEFCYDRALATWIKQVAEEMGFVPIDIPQTFGALSTPTKWFRSKVYNKCFIHDNNPVLSWAIGNAVTRTGPSENLLLDKGRAKDRIDPVAATINACVRAMANEDNRPAYEKRAMRSLTD